MKSAPPKASLLATAAAILGMGGTHAGAASKPMRLRAPDPVFIPRTLLRLRPSLSQSPTYNQRKARKARRQRWAAGDRKAFR